MAKLQVVGGTEKNKSMSDKNVTNRVARAYEMGYSAGYAAADAEIAEAAKRMAAAALGQTAAIPRQ
jgi:hypothetical protein